ncbi:MAG: hypothetical protein P4L96_19225 [Rhodoferax sp.]|nr:hypothetical protein [Rhodoferax sp.]
MNTPHSRWPAIAIMAGLFTLLLCGCAVGVGYGYGYGDDVGFGVDYYEPYGGDYGGWGPGYRAGPFGGGERGAVRGGGPSSRQHAYRAAPASRAMPSIPSRGRSGGSGSGRR